MADLKTVLKKVKTELTRQDKVRENAHENMRKATSLSKRTILLIHRKRFEEAENTIEKAKDLILRLFREKIDAIMGSGQFHDFKTELQEKTQQLFSTIPEYKLIKQEGAEHKKIFTIEVYISGERFGKGAGKSKKEAETLAAKEALKKLH